MRIPAPNYTQTPNDLFDHWLPFLSEYELKVLLVIMRKTLGWHKENFRDRISLSQLEHLTGCKQSKIISAARSLESKGLIKKEVYGPIGKQKTIYELVVTEEQGNSNNSYPSQIGRGPLPGREGTPPRMGDTKQTLPKETFHKETNKQDVVVCSSIEEDEEKATLLKRYGFTEELIAQFLFLSLVHLQEATAAFEQYKSAQEKRGGKIDNTFGTLRTAIIAGWKPNVTKGDKEKEKQKKAADIENIKKVNLELAYKTFEENRHLFDENFSFTINDTHVSLKYPENCYFPLALTDDDFATLLEFYISR